MKRPPDPLRLNSIGTRFDPNWGLVSVSFRLNVWAASALLALAMLLVVEGARSYAAQIAELL